MQRGGEFGAEQGGQRRDEEGQYQGGITTDPYENTDVSQHNSAPFVFSGAISYRIYFHPQLGFPLRQRLKLQIRPPDGQSSALIRVAFRSGPYLASETGAYNLIKGAR